RRNAGIGATLQLRADRRSRGGDYLQHHPYSLSFRTKDKFEDSSADNMTKRVLIADDSPVVRRVMRACLEERADIEVCGQTANGLETVNAAMDLRPDLIILDVLMPGLNGIEVAKILKRSVSSAKIILFTMFGDYVGNAVAAAAGVNIVLPKPDGLSALVQAVNSLLDITPIA